MPALVRSAEQRRHDDVPWREASNVQIRSRMLAGRGTVAVLLAISLAACGGSGSENGSTGSPAAGHSGGSRPAGSGGIGDQPLRMGVIPYENPQKEQEEYTPFAAFVGKKINGHPGTVSVAQQYVGVITALENGQIDAAYLNPLGYAIAANRAQKSGHPLIPIAMPYVITGGKKHGDLSYQGVIFTRVDSGVHSLKDLKGRTMAFNEKTSTSGYLYPFAMLLKAGVNPRPQPEGDLKQAFFAGGQGVVPAVFTRHADAGAIFEEAITLAYPNPADRAQLRVLAKTDPIPNGMLVARGDLDPAVIEKFKKAMADINTDPAGKTALQAMHIEKWVPANDSLFDPVRKAADILHLDLETLKQKAKG